MSVREPNPLPGEGGINRLLVGVLRVLAGLFFVLGGLALFNGIAMIQAARELTEVPVRLVFGEKVSIEFETRARFPLTFDIEFVESARFSKAALNDVVNNHKTQLRILWKVFRNNDEVASGSSENARFGAGRNEANLGSFELKKVGTYRLEASVEKVPDTLRSESATFLVKTAFGDANRGNRGGSVMKGCGIALSIIGAMFAVVSVIAKGRW